jgi:lipopolysaccharide transport system permease protein
VSPKTAAGARVAITGARGGSWRYVGADDRSGSPVRRLLSVWKHRFLLRRMAERELRLRYVGSALGFAWAAVYPLLFVAVYAFIFTVVFRGRLSPDAPTEQYALYAVSGLIPWVALSEVATRATQTMSEHRSLIKYVVFPVQILPLTSLYVTTFSQLVGLGAVIALAAWLRGGLDPLILLLPVILLLQGVFLAGVAWLLGAVGVVLRDIKELVQVALMIGMFLTPIFYVERELPARVRFLVEFNPATHLVRLYRDALLGDGLQHPYSLAVFTVVALATLLLGQFVFERTRAFLSDVL